MARWLARGLGRGSCIEKHMGTRAARCACGSHWRHVAAGKSSVRGFLATFLDVANLDREICSRCCLLSWRVPKPVLEQREKRPRIFNRRAALPKAPAGPYR